ncbi:MAG: DUF2385 domain-containing protein [Parvularculaceae bacterium]
MLARFVAAFFLLAALPAAAQDDYAARKGALTGLSGIFGELHHIRRMCAARGKRYLARPMKRLIELETAGL